MYFETLTLDRAPISGIFGKFGDRMRRRELIFFLGSAMAAAHPPRVQRQGMPVIGSPPWQPTSSAATRRGCDKRHTFSTSVESAISSISIIFIIGRPGG
jgi:hypothetical protein